MSPADLATLSLLDPDQGVCPDRHPCRLDDREIGRRRCAAGEYRGVALICWDITGEAIDTAEALRADATGIAWVGSFVGDRAGSANRP